MPQFSWNDQGVLVTGGAGFLGLHLVQALEERGAMLAQMHPAIFNEAARAFSKVRYRWHYWCNQDYHR
jgi:nucleoside-diphosphate-sugar epimerase